MMSKLDFVRFSFQLFREKKIFFFFTSECYVCVTFDHFWMKINFNQILIKSGEKIRSTHTQCGKKIDGNLPLLLPRQRRRRR